MITSGLLYTSVCFPVSLILGLLAARNAKQIGVKEIPRLFSRTNRTLGVNVNENGSQGGWGGQLTEGFQTAMGMSNSGTGYQQDSKLNSYTSDPNLPRNKKSTRWNLIKQVCAVVSLLLLFLPLVVFLCMLLPDEFTEITHYTIQVAI